MFKSVLYANLQKKDDNASWKIIEDVVSLLNKMNKLEIYVESIINH